MNGIKVIENGNSITIEWDKKRFPNMIEGIKEYLEDLADIELAEKFEKEDRGKPSVKFHELLDDLEVAGKLSEERVKAYKNALPD